MTRRVEGSLRRKVFSQCGGLKFERDVRTLIVFFSERSTRNVRKRFLRLTEMALLGMIAIRLKDQLLKWDGKNLKFTNNETANKLLHKDYRDGWTLK